MTVYKLKIIRFNMSGMYKDKTHHPFHHIWDIFLCFILLWFLLTQLLCFYTEHFDSEYPLGIFLEESKSDELSEFAQFHD